MKTIGLALLGTASLVALTGCDTVQLSYRQPGNTTDQAVGDANDGYHYFELPRSYIVIAKAQQGDAKPQSNQPAKPASNGAAQVNVAGSGHGIPSNHGGGHANIGNNTGQQPQAPSTGQPAAAGDGGQDHTSPLTATLPNFPAQQIGPDSWSATVIPVPSGVGLMVKGHVNYWQSTTLGIARFANTDMPSTVTSKAENLVSKRVGQILGVAADVTSLASSGTLFVASGTPTPSLKPLSIAVSGADGQTGPANDGWMWTLTYDDKGKPSAAISSAQIPFDPRDSSTGAGVGYWPVPACRAATLTVKSGDNQESAAFHVTVGTPEFVRLEPLPVDGELDLGTVCSGSTKGTGDADPGTDAFNIIDGIAKGLQPKPSTQSNGQGNGTPAVNPNQ
jgi:hypothetical protein